MPPRIDKIVHQTLLGEALASAFERADFAVVVSDDDGNIIAANDAMAQLLGYTLEELTSLHAQDVSGRPDFGDTKAVYDELASGAYVTGQAVLKRKDGVVGTIGYRAYNARISRLPVLVSITDDIDTFEPQT